jgi:hypothetical protein
MRGQTGSHIEAFNQWDHLEVTWEVCHDFLSAESVFFSEIVQMRENYVRSY